MLKYLRYLFPDPCPVVINAFRLNYLFLTAKMFRKWHADRLFFNLFRLFTLVCNDLFSCFLCYLFFLRQDIKAAKIKLSLGRILGYELLATCLPELTPVPGKLIS
jgi:hypothetical protein